jgi:hypothetical protein
MELTPSQLDSLKTWLAANAVGQDDEQAAALLNAAASPSYWVWKSFVRDEDIYTQLSVDATTWSWTIFIARSQGERDGWRQMVNMAGGIKPYLSNTRTGVADIFSGAGGANQRTHLRSHRRQRVRGEEPALAEYPLARRHGERESGREQDGKHHRLNRRYVEGFGPQQGAEEVQHRDHRRQHCCAVPPHDLEHCRIVTR